MNNPYFQGSPFPPETLWGFWNVSSSQNVQFLGAGDDKTIVGLHIEYNQTSPSTLYCNQNGEGNVEIFHITKDFNADAYYYQCNYGTISYIAGSGGLKSDKITMFYTNYSFDTSMSTSTSLQNSTQVCEQAGSYEYCYKTADIFSNFFLEFSVVAIVILGLIWIFKKKK